MTPTILTFLLTLGSPDPSLLAPGPKELEAARDRTRTAVATSEALGTAVMRLQNRLGEWRAQGNKNLDRCDPPELSSVLARSPLFLSAYRDGIQNARAKFQRLERIMKAPTLTSILSPAAIEEEKGFEARIERQARMYLEALSWHRQFVTPLLRSCARPLSAMNGPVAGIPASSSRGDRDTPFVAVLGLGGGVICPAGIPADGKVVTVEKGMACYGAPSCDCTPERVHAGAILAPVRTSTAVVEEPIAIVDGDAGVPDGAIPDGSGPRFARVPATSTVTSGPVMAETSTSPDIDLEVPKVEMEPFPPEEALTATTTPPAE